MNEIKIAALCEATYELGEGPHWSEEDQSLLFVDMLKGNIHRYFLQTQKMQNAHIDTVPGGVVSFIIPVEDAKDTFVIGLGTSVALIKWSSTEPDNQIKKPILLVSLDANQAQNLQFNDAKCDSEGRLYTGTTQSDFGENCEMKRGSIYSINSDIKISRLVSKQVSLSNGMAWSRDNKTFYYIDTLELRIDAFDYSLKTGDISNRRPAFEYKLHPEVKGFPDGMSIDENDNLWVANFEGSQILNIDPRKGKLLKILNMPVRYVTSCCWGGSDYSILFVTSGTLDGESERKAFPDTGKSFAVTGLGVKGLPPKKFKINNLSKYFGS